MQLEPGTTLGHYEILSSLGAGGMGEVYRAKDTKLGREVAIKLLLEEVASDPERLARFEREARVLASLNHSNVATLYGFEREGDTSFLIMELVKGDTLADVIAGGPMVIDEVIPLFLGIADGLEAAHESGVVHRDLKPANVKVTQVGGDSNRGVKILDFGLAKPTFAGAGGDPSESPTITQVATLAATRQGQILGTAAYMAPEQAKGREVDRRADVWAFGVCLYEALTGKRAFRGEDAADTLAAVLRGDVDWSELPRDTPRSILRLLRRCLVREPARRLRDIGDAALELRDFLEAEPESDSRTTQRAQRPTRWLGLGLLVAGLSLGVILTRQAMPPAEEAERHLVRWAVSGSQSPPPVISESSSLVDLAITPDGQRLIYVVEQDDRQVLFVRRVDELEGEVLAQTMSEGLIMTPFVSPDGQWIGYWDAADTSLKKVSVDGGSPLTVLRKDINGWPGGASWGLDGTIVISVDDGLHRVSASGSDFERLTSIDGDRGEVRHEDPVHVAGTSQVLFTVETVDAVEVTIMSLETGDRRTLVRRGSRAFYAPSGHLIYAVEGVVVADRFDLQNLEVEGKPTPVLEGVVTKPRGNASMALSESGRLVFVQGELRGEERRRVAWVDRDGRSEPLAMPIAAYWHLRISPDGKRAVIELKTTGGRDLWLWDFSRGTHDRFVSDPAIDMHPVWTPDGTTIIFSSERDGGEANIYSKLVEGTGAAERLTRSPNSQYPNSVSPDGNWLVYQEHADNEDLYLLPLHGAHEPVPLLASEFDERGGQISPDGKWLVYHSDESGGYEVFVRPFPDVGARRSRVSVDGGCCAVWSRDGTEVFFRNLVKDELYAVAVDTVSGFQAGPPQVLFEWDAWGYGYATAYDVSADGRFLASLLADSQEGDPYRVVVIENWLDELERLVPTD